MCEKTHHKMKIRFWHPHLSRSAKEYCNDCLTCTKSKPRRKPKAPLQPIPSGYPIEWLHIDIVGPLLQTKRWSHFILTVQCSFTKWAETYAMQNQWASAVYVLKFSSRTGSVGLEFQTVYTQIKGAVLSQQCSKKCVCCLPSRRKWTDRKINLHAYCKGRRTT